MKNYVKIHLHTMLSNSFTTMDSITKYTDYVLKAKELGMKAITFSEHGHVMEFVHKKEFCDKNGIKYIHASEVYVTESLDSKVRDNYHCVLFSKNYQGVLELNELLSHNVACNRRDGHFYYQPRITIDELINTSDNILISTACLGGILFKGNDNIKNTFIEFLVKNKHRCFLEIQHHLEQNQISYNKYLYELHKNTGIKLITGTDTHALNDEHMDGRKILQKAKNIHFEDEDSWDLTFKSYDELVECYKKQSSLPMDVVLNAIENTNVLADMVEDFSLDKSFKYPKLYNNSEDVFREKIENGKLRRNLHDKYDKKILDDRIEYELSVMKSQDNIDYFLLEDDVKTYARNNDIGYGYSRGSCSGSMICYALGITDVDSIKYDMSFERFLSPSRVSLADVDTDYPPSKRELIKDYLYNKHGLYCSEIVTFNTIALKGAIKDVCRALYRKCDIPEDLLKRSEIEVEGYGKMFDDTSRQIDEFMNGDYLKISNYISENIENDEDNIRNNYPNVFKYVDLLIGVIVSVGVHPSATIVSPHPLSNTVGTFTTTTCKFPISQINMKEIDSLNYVKLDLLGLDNIELIDETCKLAGIERLSPDNMDFQDWNVWEEILKSGLGIFQWESPSAHRYYRQLFSKDTIDKIKQVNPNMQYIDLFSTGNGAIRPAGASYRNELAKGIYNENGHKALNELLSPTLGYLVYQETLLQFLNIFCGYSLGDADIVRRGFAKKTGTEQFIPIIKEGFIKTMVEKYNTLENEAELLIEQFLTVIIDASDYLFSKNHSDPYSMIGFACGYLRHYHTLEFLTVLMNINKDDQEKTSKVMDYINKFTDIKVYSPTFRHSKDSYSFDKKNNSIYKGVASIKHLNPDVANYLYELKDFKFESFTSLLAHIKSSDSKVNKKQLDILIKLGYFKEFGDSKKLVNVLNLYNDWATKKTAKKENTTFNMDLVRRYSGKESEKQFGDVDYFSIISEVEKTLPNENFTTKEMIGFQTEYLGYVDLILGGDKKRTVVVGKKVGDYNTIVNLYSLGSGNVAQFKLKKKDYRDNFEIGDILNIKSCSKKFKVVPRKGDDGEIIRNSKGSPKFYDETEELEWILESYIVEE